MKTTEQAVQKNIIRSSFLLKRKKIAKADGDKNFITKKENLIVFLNQLLTNINSKNINNMSIGGYRSLKGEVPLEGFYKSLPYSCGFPKVDKNVLNFHNTSKESLTDDNINNLKYWSKSNLGIFEPKLKKESFIPKLLLIPGVAFDKNFMRLGFGGGFYDKFLKNYLGIKIGISFSDYIFKDRLPKESHDIAMDFIVTDKCILQNTNSLKIKE